MALLWIALTWVVLAFVSWLVLCPLFAVNPRDDDGHP